MSLVLPIPAGLNTLLVTETDLGRGFSIDENSGNAKKDTVFIYNQKNVLTSNPLVDSNKLTLIRDQDSLKSALDVGGELSLSYGLISGKIMGNYIDNNSSNSEKLTFLYTRRIVSKIVELGYDAQPSKEIASIKDIEGLRANYGLFYISKIEYGAILDLKITLESSDESTMKQIKGELEGSVSIGAFSLSVKAHIDKTDSSSKSKLNVTSSVLMGGCKQVNKTDIKSFDEAMSVIESFAVDTERLVPVRMEISPMPSRLTPLLSIDPISFAHYKNKLSLVGNYYWDLQQMVVQLDVYKQLVLPILEDEEMANYVQTLFTKVSQFLSSLKKLQQKLVDFMQNTMESILKDAIPLQDVDIAELKINAQQLIGSTFTQTDRGTWFGPTVDKIPTYKGTYTFKDGSVYKGFCLNGKLDGKGTMTYPDGNINQLKSIDGQWKNDEVYFPSIIIDAEDKVENITTARGCISWNENHKKVIAQKCVTVSDRSLGDEYIIKISVNVDMIQDNLFQSFFSKLLRSVEKDPRKRFYFMVMGMTGTGKTTLIEFFLNILTGQVNAPQSLRAINIENKGAGESKTKYVCRYEIEYSFKHAWMFGITLVDTPGFADVGGLKEDKNHTKSILKTVGKLERLDSVSYIVNGALTRKTLEPLRVLCNVFSILPVEAFDCVSTIITFCDNENQANGVRKVLNEMLDGIIEKPALYLDNPWSQHLNNKFKEGSDGADTKDKSGVLSGVDNTNELQQKMEAKTTKIHEFFLNTICSNKSFKPEGMKMLSDLKDEIDTKLYDIAITEQKLATITRSLKDLTDVNIESLIKKAQSINLRDWLKDRGFALFEDGRPRAKIMGKIPFQGGVHSTVCFAPECRNMVCHQGCQIQYNAERGNNVFKSCYAFGGSQNCKFCPNECTYKQHVHVRCQLEWIEDNDVLETYYSLTKGAKSAAEESKKLQEQANPLNKLYSYQLEEFSKLKTKFKDLAVLGDLRLIIDSSLRTYKQQMEIAQRSKSQEKVDNLQKIIDQLESFIVALDDAENDESRISKQFTDINKRADNNVSKLDKIIDGITNLKIAVVNKFTK